MTLRDLKKSKMQDKGLTCMFVGYAKDHAGDCYRMYNPDTSRVHTTRDVKWLGRMYYKDERFSSTKESSAFESGKGVKVEDDQDDDSHIELEFSNNFDDQDSSSTSESDSPEDEEESEDEETTSEQEQDSDSMSDSDDDPYRNISLKEDKGEYQATTRSGREVFAPKRIHYPH